MHSSQQDLCDATMAQESAEEPEETTAPTPLFPPDADDTLLFIYHAFQRLLTTELQPNLHEHLFLENISSFFLSPVYLPTLKIQAK